MGDRGQQADVDGSTTDDNGVERYTTKGRDFPEFPVLMRSPIYALISEYSDRLRNAG